MKKYMIALLMMCLFLMMCTSHVPEKGYYPVDKIETSSVEVSFQTQREFNTRLLEIAEDIKKSSDDLSKFRDKLGFKESSDTWDTINQFGYIGRYQFGKLALKDVGVKNTNKFLKDTISQNKALLRLLSINSYRLRYYLPEKSDTLWIHGIPSTRSGLLAGAHLVGAGGVKRWIKTGEIPKDANGTKMTTYIKMFNGYRMDIIREKRKYHEN